MTTAEVVLRIRRHLFLDPQEFADALGLTRMSIFNYEKGKSQPKLYIIKQMLEMAKTAGLDVKVDDFFN